MDRRSLLVGGGVGVGLVVAWAMWPRRYPVTWRAAPGETLINAFLKIGSDGRVVVAVPQAELGQGVYTSLPQILADELGADWRTVAVEPAPINPLYANPLPADEESGDADAGLAGRVIQWARSEAVPPPVAMMTGGSTSVRAFEEPLRTAGAAARVLLSTAAAKRWNVEWETLDSHSGFIWNGRQRLRFAELAEEAAAFPPPDDPPLRTGEGNRLVGQSLPRLDLPSKVDGSAQFAGDIRLPDMLFAAVRQGPAGDTSVVRFDRAAAERVPGVRAVLAQGGWVAAAATNWWAANRAVEAARPRFATRGALAGSAEVDAALAGAFRRGGQVMASRGDAAEALAEGDVLRARYSVGAAPTAALETLTATVRTSGDLIELWVPTQAPALARAAAARAAGLAESHVTVYPTLVGGGYGRKLEITAIEQAVTIALAVKRPVQLSWSRLEEGLHDSFRPPAAAELTGRLDDAGAIFGWKARIAVPSSGAEVARRIRTGKGGPQDRAEAAAVAGAMPLYAIPSVSIEHCPAAVGVPTGQWRSAAHSYACFFTESFIDELARQAKSDPQSFRMQMLGDTPRLGRVLMTACELGDWNGGRSGSAMGLAVHGAFGSFVALVVEIEINDRKVRVRRASCAVDCGRVVNPEIVRQQVEGGIMFGIGAATGLPAGFRDGLATAKGFGDLGLPLLGDTPEVAVEILPSEEPPGGVTELGVPPVAPAIANAIFALTGQRLRTLPLSLGRRS